MGAGGAGGGAVWGGVLGVVPGVGSGDVAHGALIWRFFLVISRAFGLLRRRLRFPGRDGLYGRGLLGYR